MRKATVYFRDKICGTLTDYGDRFEFQYGEEYINDGLPISVTFPLQKEPFISANLHSFFDGLIIEGWLLKEAERNWKINPNDRFSLLMLVGRDTIGAVSVEEDKHYAD